MIINRQTRPRQRPANHDQVMNMQVKAAFAFYTVNIGGSGPSGPTLR